MHNIKVQEFEGPLDLLLQLIEDQKLEITKVALAEVTEQYIRMLNQKQDQVKTEELADFLVIAARLLLIKSRALLPFLQWDEEEDGEDLTKQLKMYKEFLEASKVVSKMIGKKQFAFSRQKLAVQLEASFLPPPGLTVGELAKTFAEVIRRLDPYVNLPSEVIKKSINIQEKIASIRERIFREVTTNFSEILKDAKDKTEIIVSFLALLELIKQRSVVARQSGSFNDITIERIETA